MQLVILAGGKGTRMGDLARDVPKPMVRIVGKPILEHQIEIARRHGVTDIVLLTGHLAEVIEAYFGDGSRWGVNIRHVREAAPLGTAGAMKAIEHLAKGDFVVFYGDTIFDLDLDALVVQHRKWKAAATLVVHPNDHPYDSDLVEADAAGRITAFHRKPHAPGVLRRNLVSAALYVMSPAVLQHVRAGVAADFGRDVFPAMVAADEKLFAYNTPEFLKDVGTPERHRQVEHDLLTGRVARLNRLNQRPAIFLDRDGVLNEEKTDHVRTPADLKLLPGVAEAVAQINRSDYLAVVVTNQPMIAKGLADEAALEQVHAKLEAGLSERHAFVDRIYYCPHHPEVGHPGERKELKIPCDCRKPHPGMLLRAARELNIDLARSYIIGDRTVDIETGRRAGTKTILVRTGFGGSDRKCDATPDAVCDDLKQAVELILR
jgi:histidinol-phosphate phosphatase family protein